MEILLSNTIFFVNFLCGIIFIITSLISLKYPPKAINHLYGYRTKRSMASKEAWDFAQSYSNKKLFEMGLILILLGIISIPVEINEFLGILISILMIIGLTILLYYQTESKLKKL